MNNISKNNSLTVFLFLFSYIAFSQTEIKNKILDFNTLAPIESASIYIQNTTTGTISNVDGKFVLLVPETALNDTLVISSIGYKSFKSLVKDFDNTSEIYLEEDIAALDEVVLTADTRPKTGNDIVLKMISKLPDNLPELPYLQKGFLRHKEQNKKEFKWLIESAITLYDSAYTASASDNLKINVDQMRKSYDLRDVDSLLAYTAYLKNIYKKKTFKAKNLSRDTIETASLIKAIKWNDIRTNGLGNLFLGKLNLLRNANVNRALFGERVLDFHQFELDTVLVDDGRKVYKVKIVNGPDYINLETPGIFNDGYHANGWLYIYWDNYAVKKIEYELIAASEAQKTRSKILFDTRINHKLELSYIEYEGKMYLNYMYYETPKLVNVGSKTVKSADELYTTNSDERYYKSVQEILFSEIVVEQDAVLEALKKDWDSDIFSVKPYNKKFWENYNTLLESEEDEKLIQDLTRRSSLYKE